MTPEERRGHYEYQQALAENDLWDAAVRRSWEKRYFWDEIELRWRGETDQEWRERVSKLKWKFEGGDIVFLG